MTVRKRKTEDSNHIKGRDLEKPVDYDKNRPVFSFYNIQKGFSLDDLENDEKFSFIKKIVLISQSKWIELKNANKNGYGCEVLTNRNSIKATMPSCFPNDASIVVFRFHEKKPMIGFRQKDVFHIVWLDKNLTIYDH